MEATRSFVKRYNEQMFTIEEVSAAIKMWPDATRKWLSRSKISGLDAEIGVKGKRVLFSPCDFLQLLIASRFSHAQIAFKGISPIQRRTTNPDYIPPRFTLDDEIRRQVHINLYQVIYDMGEIEVGKPCFFFQSGLENGKYFIIFFNPELAQSINGEMQNFGGLDFRATSDPLSECPTDGLIIIIDCFELAKIALNLFKAIK